MLISTILFTSTATRKTYNTANIPLSSTLLNVHLIPHTHNDPGWTKTVDEYYTGGWINEDGSAVSGGWGEGGAVRYILDSVEASLTKDRARGGGRRFTYVEIAFFSRWFDEQDDATQARVAALVAEGRLSFANGGWVMNDEATPSFGDMIDQLTLGHLYLRRAFPHTINAIPRVGWQIDPFGHSNGMAEMFALSGFSAFHFARIDYQDRAKREAEHTTEVVMQPSHSLNSSGHSGLNVDILAGAMHQYNQLEGFYFENAKALPGGPLQDNPALRGYNVEFWVEKFVVAIAKRRLAMGPNSRHIMITMGSDFNYENAPLWYESLDRLIHHVNIDGRLNVLYATPQSYTEAIHAEAAVMNRRKRPSANGLQEQEPAAAAAAGKRIFPTKRDDWLPYADFKHSYWSGYFTSRPALKRYIRSSSSLLNACRQLEVSGIFFAKQQASASLWKAVSLTQHHDAITGTSKQHVADDYAERLSIGRALCYDSIAKQLGVPLATPCRLLNESVCAATTSLNSNSSGGVVHISVYNPLGQSQSHMISLPVRVGTSLPPTLRIRNGRTALSLPTQLLPLPPSASSAARRAADHVLIASIPLAPLSATHLVLEAGGAAARDEGERHEEERFSAPAARAPSGLSNISNLVYTLYFNESSGELHSIRNLLTGVSCALTQQWGWYNGSNGTLSDPRASSGAYVFRPACVSDESARGGDCKLTLPVPNKIVLRIDKGAVVEEATQIFSPWLSQTIRLRRSTAARPSFFDINDHMEMRSIEVEWRVGAIPIGDRVGKEIVTRWSTDLATQGIMYTDSNGRELQRRVRDARPTWLLNVTERIAGNYFPTTLTAQIRDEGVAANAAAARQLSVITDRAQGAASVIDGTIELMVHRRLLTLDHKGVGEVLNETEGGRDTTYNLSKTPPQETSLGPGLKIIGRHFLVFDLVGTESASAAVGTAAAALAEPVVLFGHEPAASASSSLHGRQRHHPNPQSAEELKRAPPSHGGLPPAVRLLTLQALGRDNTAGGLGFASTVAKLAKLNSSESVLLLRLAHRFSVDDGALLSAEASVDLFSFLPTATATISVCVELSLTANQLIVDAEGARLLWPTEEEERTARGRRKRRSRVRWTRLSGGIVVLKAMQVRTWACTYRNSTV